MGIGSRLAEIARGLARLNRLDSSLRAIEERLVYLQNETGDLREHTRMLLADSPRFQAEMEQTRRSFDTQWDALALGTLGDARSINEEPIESICRLTGLSPDWFARRRIIDVGCGSGRWSLALCKLGAVVTAVDQSPHALESVSTLCSEYEGFTALSVNLLEELPFSPESFDLVWCFGVLHHTGDTRRTFDRVAELVRPGGCLFLMLYGEPETPPDYAEVNAYVMHRRATVGMTLEERMRYCKEQFPAEDAHGWFDAISPRVNDLHRMDEIRGWLSDSGFERISRTSANRNLHVVARRRAASP
jgi:2-polyprenyl-3-methyl-5-hydroxy-6-metoxy-1,4-benzoquinol methylase